MAKKIFVNLPVSNLEASTTFFAGLGFDINPQFSDDNAACLVISDDIFVMLLVEDYFQTFTAKQICDARTHTEAILALSAESRQEVDDLVTKAIATGGSPSNEPIDQDGMYGWSFQDPDGHLWEVMHMGE
ncbi:VOC family protein [Nocardiopsis ansamitocini]|uniref:Extradiol dioxygenase n=1 Tax=Nocardiopsis ansamitocini TaxID=1670832 RepID=A0A9W6UGK3_9ACTN|nr:VOC family protein [Nocardiopsis ansamitocini]GLU47641.1 extradiol dioxygenase [Nocardiopsis ansamitocini]